MEETNKFNDIEIVTVLPEDIIDIDINIDNNTSLDNLTIDLPVQTINDIPPEFNNLPVNLDDIGEGINLDIDTNLKPKNNILSHIDINISKSELYELKNRVDLNGTQIGKTVDSLINIFNNNYTSKDLSNWFNYTNKLDQKISAKKPPIIMKALNEAFQEVVEKIDDKRTLLALNSSKELAQLIQKVNNGEYNEIQTLDYMKAIFNNNMVEEDIIEEMQGLYEAKLYLNEIKASGDFKKENLIVDILDVTETGVFTYKCPVCGEIHKSTFFNINITTESLQNNIDFLAINDLIKTNVINCINTQEQLIITPELYFNILDVIRNANSTKTNFNITKIFNNLKKEEIENEEKSFAHLTNLLNKNIQDWNKEVLNKSNESIEILNIKNSILLSKSPLADLNLDEKIYLLAKSPITKYFSKKIEEINDTQNLIVIVIAEIIKLMNISATENIDTTIYTRDGKQILEQEETILHCTNIIISNLENVINKVLTSFKNSKDIVDILKSSILSIRENKITKNVFKNLNLNLLETFNNLEEQKLDYRNFFNKFNSLNALYLLTNMNNDLKIDTTDEDLQKFYSIFNNKTDFNNYCLNLKYLTIRLSLTTEIIENISNDYDLSFSEFKEDREELCKEYFTTERHVKNYAGMPPTLKIGDGDLSLFLIYLKNSYIENIPVGIKSSDNGHFNFRITYNTLKDFNSILINLITDVLKVNTSDNFLFVDNKNLSDVVLSIIDEINYNSGIINQDLMVEFLIEGLNLTDTTITNLLNKPKKVKTYDKISDYFFEELHLINYDNNIKKLKNILTKEKYLYIDGTVNLTKLDDIVAEITNPSEEDYSMFESLFKLNEFNLKLLFKMLFPNLDSDEIFSKNYKNIDANFKDIINSNIINDELTIKIIQLVLSLMTGDLGKNIFSQQCDYVDKTGRNVVNSFNNILYCLDFPNSTRLRDLSRLPNEFLIIAIALYQAKVIDYLFINLDKGYIKIINDYKKDILLKVLK